jgi:RHS repeat-associated protein
VLFFNDKLELVEGGSSITQVPAVPMGGNMGGFITLTPVGPVTGGGTQACCIAPGPGYAVIYIDNQSIGKDVWFDNIMIEHYTGKVQEESHYYPFGLTLQTSAELNHKEQPIKFQSQQHENDFELNMYSFKWREHDPQIGRFWQIDPLSDKYVHNSTYAFSENKVTSHIELEGLESVPINPSATLWRSAGISSSSDPNKFLRDVGKEALNPRTWLEANAVVAQTIALPFIVGVFTGGLGEGAIVESGVASSRALMAESAAVGDLYSATRAIEQVVANSELKLESVAITGNGNYNRYIVIGRSMGTRVVPFTQELQAAGIQAESWEGFNILASDAENLANNSAWFQQKVKNGYSVIDIGLDPTFKNTPTGANPGLFYGMEQRSANAMQNSGTATITKQPPVQSEDIDLMVH